MSPTHARDFAIDPLDPVEGWKTGCVRVGSGELGGKAHGLTFFNDMLNAEFRTERFPELDVAVPSFAVLTTEVFDAFIEQNSLVEIVDSDADDIELAHAFQAAALPDAVRTFLAVLLEFVHVPLAIRSSSLLEDAISCPFAGIYETKMLPNNHPDTSTRLDHLELAIKLVFASTYFRGARSVRAAMGKKAAQEKMAVIVQEVVGNRCGDRFYPRVSGVARSHDFYSSALARPEDGVVSLALGLGKAIVDGDVTWSYSPARPKAPPPFGSVQDIVRNSQLEFWSVNLAADVSGAPTEETEFLVRANLATAETDGALDLVASTYIGRSDRLRPGIGYSGPRVLNFAPLLALRALPLNDVIRDLLAIGERAAGGEIEIEFALSAAEGADDRARLGLLQVRPMAVSDEQVTIAPDEWSNDDMLLASTRVMGNCCDDRIRDLVFVKPGDFEGRNTPAIAAELEKLNREMLERNRPYVLIGFGRWGSSDPWLGIPVDWSQICGARVIVEATLPSMNVEPSQGSHFFHNIASCGVSYLSVHHSSTPGIDWNRLQALPVYTETRFVRRVELDRPLRVKVDGRTGRGGIWRTSRDH